MKIYVALPVRREFAYIKDTLDCIFQQDCKTDYEIHICINQPEENIGTDEYFDNQKTLAYLYSLNDKRIIINDRSSKGKALSKEISHVGTARKIIMENISKIADDNDVIISMDADTKFNNNYFEAIIKRLDDIQISALSIPYYHPLTGEEILDRAMLRYEIYLRNYLINLLRIKSPYAFTALGSAIVLKAGLYRKIKGITAKKSGEDFYFLQKIRKTTDIGLWNEEIVYPGTRYSDRVIFGTGPALLKGMNSDWTSYPVYDYKLFDDISIAYKMFEKLYVEDLETPMSKFLDETENSKEIWSILRANYKNKNQFVRACHVKIDGLKILQYLKTMQSKILFQDENNLEQFLNKFYKNELIAEKIDIKTLSFSSSSIELINNIRDFMFNVEQKLRVRHDLGLKKGKKDKS